MQRILENWESTRATQGRQQVGPYESNDRKESIQLALTSASGRIVWSQDHIIKQGRETERERERERQINPYISAMAATFNPIVASFLKPRRSSSLLFSPPSPLHSAHLNHISSPFLSPCHCHCHFQARNHQTSVSGPNVLFASSSKGKGSQKRRSGDGVLVGATSSGESVLESSSAESTGASGLVKTLQLGSLFGLWYLLNIYFNIYNKQVFSLYTKPFLHHMIQASTLQSILYENLSQLSWASKSKHGICYILLKIISQSLIDMPLHFSNRSSRFFHFP